MGFQAYEGVSVVSEIQEGAFAGLLDGKDADGAGALAVDDARMS